MSNLCENGKCVNTLGSYRCQCNKGFRIDRSGTVCKDVNECQQNDHQKGPCQFYCKNIIGMFEVIRYLCPKNMKTN